MKRREIFLSVRSTVSNTQCWRVWRDGEASVCIGWGSYLYPTDPTALRHSCATHLLAEGVSLKEIADHLGHVSLVATQIYAKVDLAGTARSGRSALAEPGGYAENSERCRYADPDAAASKPFAAWPRSAWEVFYDPLRSGRTYILHKRSLGMGFRGEAVRLRAFVQAIGDRDMRLIGPAPVRRFLEGTGPLTSFWFSKYHTLKAFYRYAMARGYCSKCPFRLSSPQKPETFQPYIYTNQDISG